MKFQIRDAHLSDAEVITHLVNSAYRGESGERAWTSEAKFIGGQRVDVEGVRELISRKGSVVLLACSADAPKKILGCVHVENRGHEAFLGMLTADVALQRTGLGSFLVQAVENMARERWGSRAVKLAVISIRTELIAWYVRRGFEKTGETGSFPYGDERFGRPLVEGLYFEYLRKPLH